MRIALLGGSFDPPHRGHLHLAKAAAHEYQLGRVLLLPACRPPHKPSRDLAPDADRLAMARLLAALDPVLEVDERELSRGGVSYTMTTVEEIESEVPAGTEILFLIGSDSLAELPTWHRAAELVQRLTFVTVQRRETALATCWTDLEAAFSAELVARLRAHVLPTPPLPVSSTQVRQRVARGEAIDDLVPESIARHIERRGLYGPIGVQAETQQGGGGS